MAIIPRFVSSSPSTADINQVKMDPNLAAAPYRAAEATTEHLQNIFGKELNDWNRIYQQKEAERQQQEQKQRQVSEGLYKAEAMANLSIQANNLYQQHKMQSNGVESFAPKFDQDFQKLADHAIMNAPSEQAKIDLTKRLIGMRSSMYNKASTESLHLNNQVQMDKMEDVLGRFEAMAAANPAAVPEIKTQAQDILQSMGKLGISEINKEKIKDKFEKRLDYHALRSQADIDPIGTMQRLQQGESAHLGEGQTSALMNYAKSAIAAGKTVSGQGLDDLQSRLMSGYTLPENYEEVLRKGQEYGLQDKVSSIQKILDLGTKTANASYSELKVVSDQLKAAAASGKYDANPKQMETILKFLDGNAEAIAKDGLGYAERRGGFTPLAPIDLTKATPEEIAQRQFKAAQVKDMYQVNVPALKEDEVTALAAQLPNMSPEQATTTIRNLSALGADTSAAVAAAVQKQDPGLAVAVEAGISDPMVLQSVLQGRALSKTAKSDPIDTETLNKAQSGFLVQNPQLRSAYLDAAKSVMVSEAANGRNISFDEAVRKVGNIIDVSPTMFGSYKTQAPVAGMSSSDFESFVDSELVKDDSWNKYANGIPVDSHGDPINWKRMNPSDLTYAFNGNGNYIVLYESQPVKTENGSNLIINLKQLAENKPK